MILVLLFTSPITPFACLCMRRAATRDSVAHSKVYYIHFGINCTFMLNSENYTQTRNLNFPFLCLPQRGFTHEHTRKAIAALSWENVYTQRYVACDQAYNYVCMTACKSNCKYMYVKCFLVVRWNAWTWSTFHAFSDHLGAKQVAEVNHPTERKKLFNTHNKTNVGIAERARSLPFSFSPSLGFYEPKRKKNIVHKDNV